MRVTIGIPVYNAASTLPDAIRSIYAQSYKDWELILVDDGSTDGSFTIIEAMVAADNRVRIIRDTENRGLAYRLNQVSVLARGEYIARMDADDVMHPERLARQIAYLETHPECDAVGSSAIIIDHYANPIAIRKPHTQLAARSILRRGLFIHPTVLGRSRWFRENPYNQANRRAEDYELWVTTFPHSRFANLDEPLLFLREGTTIKLEKYLASGRDHRRVLVRIGPRVVGWPYTFYLIVQWYAKEVAYRAFTLAGLQETLVKRRNLSLTTEELAEARATLASIMSTEVSGLNV